MAIENPFAAGTAATPTGGISNPWLETAGNVAGDALHLVNPFDSGDSPSIGGFVGNVFNEVKGIVGGITGLIGQGMHDVALLTRGPNYMADHPEEFKLAQTAKALTGIGPGPSALMQDYKERYGISKFAQGDIWGGLGDVLSGFYNHPLAYVGDALLVGGAAAKGAELGAKAGIVSDSMLTRITGGTLQDVATKGGEIKQALVPGTTEGMSMTGRIEPTTLPLATNPVTRWAQNRLYSTMSVSPEAAQSWYSHLTGFDEQARAKAAIELAAQRDMPILRPIYSKALEGRATSRALSFMGLSVRDRGQAGFNEIATALKDIDKDLRGKTLPEIMQGVVPVEAPSPIIPAAYHPYGDLESLPDMPAVPITPELDGNFLEKIAKTYGKDYGQEGGYRIIDSRSARPAAPTIAPHNMTGDPGTRVVFISSDPTLADAGDIIRNVARNTGEEVVAFKNYIGDAESSYAGVHAALRDPATGAVHEVSVATPTLMQEQMRWGQVTKIMASREADLEVVGQRLSNVAEDANPEVVARDVAKYFDLQDELQAGRVYNRESFRFTNRSVNAALDGQMYDPLLQAADKISAITHNFSAAQELEHGALTFRTLLDRAFLPSRAIRWNTQMFGIERDLADYFTAIIDSGGTQADAIEGALNILDHHMGTGHPATLDAIKEALLRSQVDEAIPFTVDQTRSYLEQVNTLAREAHAPAPVPEPLGIGSMTDEGRIVGESWTEGVGKGERMLKIERPDGDITYTYAADATPVAAEGAAPVAAAPEGQLFQGTLYTGEKTILSDNNWWGPSGMADPVGAARYITDKLRRLTHKSIVENGEFPTYTWKDMVAQVEGDPLAQMPQYFPHLKPSHYTADAVMTKRGTTQLEAETNRMAKSEGTLFESGLYEHDPLLAYSRVYRQIAQHGEFRDFLKNMVSKYGRPATEEELVLATTPGAATGVTYVSRRGIDSLLGPRENFMALKNDAMMNGASAEEATMQALESLKEGALADARAAIDGLGPMDEVWALPKHVAKMIDRQAKDFLGLPPKASFFYDTGMQAWKSSVLSLSPRWVVNNTLGNLVYMGVKDPAAIRRYLELLFSPAKRAYVKSMFGDELSAEVERTFMHGELTDTQVASQVAHDRFLARAEEAGATGTAAKADALYNSKLQYLRRPVQWLSRKVFHFNEMNEQAARMGVAISEAQRTSMLSMMDRWSSTYKTMQDVMDSGLVGPSEYQNIARAVDGVLGDYLRMSPIEAGLLRRYIFPFYAFYRHTAAFLMRMPFDSPLKSKILEQINEINRQMEGSMPEYMRGSAEIMPGWFIRFGNANPLQAVTQAYAPSLSNPLLSLAVQRVTGTNPFGEPWQAPPGSVVEAPSGRSSYVILRNSDGTFAGIERIGDNKQWEPPLLTSIMGLVPQVGLITGSTVFSRQPLWRRAASFAGASIVPFDQAQYQAKATQDYYGAFASAARAAALYPGGS